MTHMIDYGNLMHRAMRGLIQQVLQDVADNGLPGQHHFFITFDTMHADVEIADHLSDRYPGEMTIVLQHEFENLTVMDDGFSVTLNFGERPEPLYIPYDAIVTFVDPSVEFGLRFETQEADEDDEDEIGGEIGDVPQPGAAEAPMIRAEGSAQDSEAEVVSLDSFRK